MSSLSYINQNNAINSTISGFTKRLYYANRRRVGASRIETRIFAYRLEETRALPSDKLSPLLNRFTQGLATPDRQLPVFTAPYKPYSKIPQAAYLTLVALERGLINSHQAASYLCYLRAVKDRGHDPAQVRAVRFFDADGSVSVVAQRILFRALGSLDMEKECSSALKEGYLREQQLSDQEWDRFVELVRKLPPSEHTFFVTHDLHGAASVPALYEKTITQRIESHVGINSFFRYQEESASGEKGRWMTIVPQISLLQAYMDTKSGDRPLKINPVLGISSVEDIRRNTFNGNRDMAIPFPGITLPLKADGFPAPGNEVTRHDFYHALIISMIPPEYREKAIEVADALNRLSSDCQTVSRNKQLYSRVRRVWWVMVEQEFTEFRPEYIKSLGKRDDGDLFWHTFLHTYATHVSSYFKQIDRELFGKGHLGEALIKEDPAQRLELIEFNRYKIEENRRDKATVDAHFAKALAPNLEKGDLDTLKNLQVVHQMHTKTGKVSRLDGAMIDAVISAGEEYLAYRMGWDGGEPAEVRCDTGLGKGSPQRERGTARFAFIYDNL